MVDTSEAVPNRYNTSLASICPWRCEQQTVSIVCLANALTYIVQPLDGQYKTGRRDSSLGTALRVSIICLHDGIARDQISQASPRRISYWNRSNTGDGNGLRMRLGVLPVNVMNS